MDPLAERAAQWGVDREYRDARGELRTSPSDALAKILDALASTDAPPRGDLPSTFILRRGRPLQPPMPDLPPDTVIGWRINSDARPLGGGAAAPSEFALPD